MLLETLNHVQLQVQLDFNSLLLTDNQFKQINLLRIICALQSKHISANVYIKIIKNKYASHKDLLKEAFSESYKPLASQYKRLVFIEQLINIYYPKGIQVKDDELIHQLLNPNPEAANLYLYNFLKDSPLNNFNHEQWEMLSSDRPFIHMVDYLKHLGIFDKLTPADAHRFLLPALLNLSFNKVQPAPDTLTVKSFVDPESEPLPSFKTTKETHSIPFELSEELINEIKKQYRFEFNFTKNQFYQAFCQQLPQQTPITEPENRKLTMRKSQLEKSLIEQYNPEYPNAIDKSFIEGELKLLMEANPNWTGLQSEIDILNPKEQQALLESAYKIMGFKEIPEHTKAINSADYTFDVIDCTNENDIKSTILNRIRIFLPIAIERKLTEIIPIRHLAEHIDGASPDVNKLIDLWLENPASDNLNTQDALKFIHSQIPFCHDDVKRGLYLELMKRSLKNGWNEIYSNAEQKIKPLTNEEHQVLLTCLPEGEEPHIVPIEDETTFEPTQPEDAPALPSVYDLNMANLMRASLLSNAWIGKISQDEAHMLKFIEVCTLKDEIKRVVDDLKDDVIPMTPNICQAIQKKCDEEQKKALLEKAISRKGAPNFKEVLETFNLGAKSYKKIGEAVTSNNLPYLKYLLVTNSQNGLVAGILNNRPDGKTLIQHALNHQNYPMVYTLIAKNHGTLRDDLFSLQKPANIDTQNPDFQNFKVVLGVFQKIDELYQRKTGIDSSDPTKGRAIDDLKNQFIASVKTLSQDNNFNQFRNSMETHIDHNKSSLMHHRGSKGILASIIRILNKLHMFTKERWKPQTLSWKMAEQAKKVIQEPQALDDSKLFKP